MLNETDAFSEWFGKSTMVDDSGAPLTLYRGSYHANGAAYNDNAMVFVTATREFAENYARHGYFHELHVRCEKPFDASRGAGLQLWKEFVAETKQESWASAGSDRGALPYWTMEQPLRAWLDAKGIDYDGIWFAESNRTASLALKSLDQIQIIDPLRSRAIMARDMLDKHFGEIQAAQTMQPVRTPSGPQRLR